MLLTKGFVIVESPVEDTQLWSTILETEPLFKEYKSGLVFGLNTGNSQIATDFVSKAKSYVSSQVMNDVFYDTAAKLLTSNCSFHWGLGDQRELKTHITSPCLAQHMH